MYDKKKYKRLDDKAIMQSLILSILGQAVRDISGIRKVSQQTKLEAVCFIKSQYCELMCAVINQNYNAMLEYANKEREKPIEKR